MCKIEVFGKPSRLCKLQPTLHIVPTEFRSKLSSALTTLAFNKILSCALLTMSPTYFFPRLDPNPQSFHPSSPILFLTTGRQYLGSHQDCANCNLPYTLCFQIKIELGSDDVRFNQILSGALLTMSPPASPRPSPLRAQNNVKEQGKKKKDHTVSLGFLQPRNSPRSGGWG